MNEKGVMVRFVSYFKSFRKLKDLIEFAGPKILRKTGTNATVKVAKKEGFPSIG